MKKVTPRDTPCYCIKARRAAGALTELYDKAMERVNLTISQFSLLNDIMYLKTCNKSELAQYAGLDRTTIIRNLNILYSAGYITEVPGINRRNNLIKLTPLGESAVSEGMEGWKLAQSKVEAAIGIDNIENFMGFLEVLGQMEKCLT